MEQCVLLTVAVGYTAGLAICVCFWSYRLTTTEIAQAHWMVGWHS